MRRIVSFCLVGLLLACEDDPTNEILPRFEIVANQDHNISFIVKENRLQLIIEVLSDTTNNLSQRNQDFFEVNIDMNANGVIDAEIDRGYGLINADGVKICANYLIAEDTRSACGRFKSKARINGSFKASELSDRPHIIWELSIPHDELPPSGRVHMIVKIFNNGYFTYPENNLYARDIRVSFDKVLVFDWLSTLE